MRAILVSEYINLLPPTPVLYFTLLFLLLLVFLTMTEENEPIHYDVLAPRTNYIHAEPQAFTENGAPSLTASFRSLNMSLWNYPYGDQEHHHHYHHHLRPADPINTYEITQEEIPLTPRPHRHQAPLHHREVEEIVRGEEDEAESAILDAPIHTHPPLPNYSFKTFSSFPTPREDAVNPSFQESFRGSFARSGLSSFRGSRAPSPAPSSTSTESDDLPVAPYGWVPLKEFPRWYWRRLTGFDQSLDAYTFSPNWDQLIGLIFTAITLVVLGIIQNYVFTPLINGSLNIFLPAFGATCTCLFAVPKLPISQPRNVLISYVSAGVIGISVVNAFINLSKQPYGIHLAGAIGVGLHQIFMVFTGTLHPPASATVVSAVEASFQTYFQDRGYLFCVTPCITGSIVVILMAILLNNLVPSRSPYPQYW